MSRRNPSRRSMLTSLPAFAALSAPRAAMAALPDPVLALIAAEREAYRRCEASDCLPDGSNPAYDAWIAAFDAVFACRPTTYRGIAGMTALLYDREAADRTDDITGVGADCLQAIVAAGAAIDAVGSDTAPADADEELLGLAAEMDAAWTRERAIFAAELGANSRESDERTDAAALFTGAIVDRMKNKRATTLAGLKAKARGVAWAFDGAPLPDFVFHEGTTAGCLAYSIVRDLLAAPLA